jgi:hypothetical protein
LLRFSGSNMAFMAELIRMRSPLASVSTCQHQADNVHSIVGISTRHK